MHENDIRAWLDAYGRAWQDRDPQAAAQLYAEDGSYISNNKML